MTLKNNRTKRKARIVVITFFCLLVIIPIVMWFWWLKSPDKPINIFILDKTVLNSSFQEHLSFNWVLNHNKYVKPNGEFYLPEKDYFGFFPDNKGSYSIKSIENITKEEIIAQSNEYDMAYFTDLYGIYWNEWHNEYPHLNPKQKTDGVVKKSQLIYGGLTSNELELLKQMKQRKKLIINEFNIIASPTSNKIRNEYEKEFDFKWTGWVGRYIDDLDTSVNKELPIWLINNYLIQNNYKWPFKNSGIIFVRNDDKIVILENKTHLNIEVPVIYTEKNFENYYSVVNKIKYPFWFDIIETGIANQIVSSYKIQTNTKGDSILQTWGIPKEFPAVIRSNRDYPFYYFAGDFSDNPINLKTSKYKYINSIGFLFYDSSTSERKSFFWKFYQPLLTKVLEDYYIILNK